jgi:hypothetical protein
VVTVVHVGLFEVLTFAYVVVIPGTTLPHTNTSAKESVAENPVNEILAVPVRDIDPRAEVADTPVAFAAPVASMPTAPIAEVADCPFSGTKAPGSCAIATSDMALKPSISQRP